MTWFENFYSRIKNSAGAKEADKGQFARAFEHYDEAIRLNPNNPEAFYNRGVAFGQTGRYDRALADLNEAIRLKPNDPDYLTNRGTAHALTGERTKAIADYDEAIRLNPKHTIALNLRARAMAMENNEPTRASRTSSQTQSTSLPHTMQASDKPNMEGPSTEIPDEQVWQTYLDYDPAIREIMKRLSSLSAKSVEEFRSLLLRYRDSSRVNEFEEVAIRRAKEFEEEELSRKLGSAADDVAVRDAYLNLNREDQRLGDEFIRVIGIIGKPKDLDRIITLVRINNKNRPADAQRTALQYVAVTGSTQKIA
jgi:tetratricopeptide repeat protein